jgi:hypothetical protein
MQIRVALGLASVAGLALVGCTSQTDSQPLDVGATVSVVDSPVRDAHKPEWANEGDRLLANKKSAVERYPEYAENMADRGNDFAYQSEPFDVLEPGPVTVRIPVPETFDYPRSPSGFGLSVPGDSSFSIVPTEESSEARIVEDASRRYLELRWVVEPSEFGFKPYPNYTIWIY